MVLKRSRRKRSHRSKRLHRTKRLFGGRKQKQKQKQKNNLSKGKFFKMSSSSKKVSYKGPKTFKHVKPINQLIIDKGYLNYKKRDSKKSKDGTKHYDSKNVNVEFGEF